MIRPISRAQLEVRQVTYEESWLKLTNIELVGSASLIRFMVTCLDAPHRRGCKSIKEEWVEGRKSLVIKDIQETAAAPHFKTRE